MGSNKTIAKNTLFLYARMIVTMLITLYTSRVILEKLGVDDFGLYQAVGGIVGFLSFLNSAISTGTSRFLTFELGAGNFEKLKRTFSTLLTAHFVLAAIIVLVAETAGLWFVCNKMVIAPDRLNAALWVFHISILTAVVSLTQVPYNSSIIAHEKMGIFASLSIFDATSKLAICYLLGMGKYDNLILYAILLFIVQVSQMIMYRVYCVRNFVETKYECVFDQTLLKPVLSFSGWSMFAHGALAFSNQGILVLLNMFFSPAVVSARAISLQVNSAAYQLVNNFQIAANPQIVKYYATEQFQESKALLLLTMRISFFLMLMIAVPIFYLATPLLTLWLGNNVPEYTVIFLQIVIIQTLFQVFDTSLYTALYAKGRLKENALLSPIIIFLAFPIVYVLFTLGCSPIALSFAYLCCYIVLALIVKPILVIKIVNYSWGDILSVYFPCLLVACVSFGLSYIIINYWNCSSIIGFILQGCTLAMLTIAVAFIFGVEKITKKRIISFIKSKI